MSLTRFAKSRAYSWMMSFCAQVLCQRIEIGPCAFTTFGKPSAAAPVAAIAAPVRNLRRDAGVVASCSLMPHLLVPAECRRRSWPRIRFCATLRGARGTPEPARWRHFTLGSDPSQGKAPRREAFPHALGTPGHRRGFHRGVEGLGGPLTGGPA